MLERYPNLDEDRRLHVYSRGEAIPLSPLGIWQVCQGLVQLSMLHSNGEEVLLGLAGPSMPFGSCLTSLETYQATALSDTKLIWLPLKEIESSLGLAQKLLPRLSWRLRQTEALLAIAGQRRVEDRLCQLLRLLKQEIGQSVVGGTRLSVRLTHQNLANTIGTSRVTVTRLLSKLKQQGRITLGPNHQIILRDEIF